MQASDTPEAEGAKTGRPTMYSNTLAALICGRIANGETLTAICKTAGLPVPGTVHRWRRENSQFSADYALAREDQMDTWGDDIVAISDDSTLDTVTVTDKKGREHEVVDHENIQRDRLRVDTRKFLMAKLAPRYADKVAHDHSGEVVHRVELSDRERMRRLASFMLQDRIAAGQPAIIEGQAVAIDQPASQSPADIVAGVATAPIDKDAEPEPNAEQ